MENTDLKIFCHIARILDISAYAGEKCVRLKVMSAFEKYAETNTGVYMEAGEFTPSKRLCLCIEAIKSRNKKT